jgi:NifU-like protein
MWEYSDKVKDHFFHPRNAKAVSRANAVGDVGSLSCGDALRLTLDVDPETETIREAGFQTFGCGSAIASSSALTEMIRGMTLDQALQVSNQDIADYLDGLPPEKMHCSVMGREALEAAIANYRGEVWADDHEEGDLVCKCFGIDSAMIERTIQQNNLRTVEDVTNFTKAGGGCTACHEAIEEIVDAMNDRRDTTAAEPVAASDPAANGNFDAVDEIDTVIEREPASTLTLLQKVRTVEAVIDQVRPAVEMDGGSIELLDFDGSKVYVALSGACTDCQLASATVSGIQQRIIEELGQFVHVVPMKKRPSESRQPASSICNPTA